MKFSEAEALAGYVPAPYARARVLRSYAAVARQHGNIEVAAAALGEAVPIFTALDSWEARLAARELQVTMGSR